MSGKSAVARGIASVVAAVLLCLASAAVAEDRAVVFSGEVAIHTTSTGEVLVALDVKPADGIADHSFTLQQGEPFETVGAHLAGARVMVRDDQVRIRGEGVELLLLVEGAVPRLQGPRDRWQVVTGFGLSHSWGGGFGLPVDVVASEPYFRRGDVALKDGPPEGPEGGSGSTGCDAGGPGATQCSVSNCEGSPSSCSVTCTSPKYACCYCAAFLEARARCKCLSGG